MTGHSPTATAGGGDAVQTEFVMTAEDFASIASILHAASGISLSPSKTSLVYSRLAKRLRLLGLESFREYCKLISGSNGVDERQAMLAALTTNVTRFFREPHHFDYLRKLMPDLSAKAKRGDRVRLWSAGCSSGEEPYSIALTILAMLPNANDLDVKILATDIDPIILAKAKDGVYSREALEPVPSDLRKYFGPVEGHRSYAPVPAVRDLVAFRELNLIGPWPMTQKFDVIFCRNVAIYFDEPTQDKLFGRYAEALNPDGRLYIGHSERVNDPRFISDGLTAYRLRSGGRA
jgi:chemotaxis protein methyltransferase CheR